MELKELRDWHQERASENKKWSTHYREQPVYHNRFKRSQQFHEAAVTLLDQQRTREYHDEDVALEQLAATQGLTNAGQVL